ncbi:ABC transporter ATP-binding protein [Desulfovibrio inopinatus]|uniref:ABC transporter ATP-binding protein n=1 Tax=Desulfovibrio inopinatus TaxID=102109 RepID=UPI000428212B|nr:ABC transporter ATP-binding protein [Desulfovibrio inopinatus]
MSVFSRLIRYLRPYRAIFFGSLCLVGIISLLELLKPWPLKLAVDQIIGGKPLDVLGFHMSLETFSPGVMAAAVALGLVSIHFFVGFVELLNNYLTIRIGQNMVHDFRVDLFDHIQRQSLLFHQRKPPGDLIYRLMGDTYAVQNLLMNGVFTILTSSLLLIGMAVVLVHLDAVLTLCALAIIPPLFLMIRLISRRIGRLTTESHNLEGQVYSTLERIFSGIVLIQAYAGEDLERDRFVNQSRSSFKKLLHLYSMQTAYGWFISGLTACGTALVLYIGVRHVLSGSLTTGGMLVFLSYLAALYSPLHNLSSTVAGVRSSLARAGRVLDIMDVDEAVVQWPNAEPLGDNVKGEVEFEHVRFGYTAESDVLREINLHVPAGSTVAIVGKTGAGKTTLVSMLPRFFDPADGAIRLDGKDIREFDLKSLREHISFVLQDTYLFPTSVRDNIAYGRRGATFEEVEAAARAADAHEFIVRLPKGYDTILGEKGADLSGGQRQRLSIARALLKNAPMLIMDEPTASLDAETETAIMHSLESLMANRTTFVIAHRLSTVRRADLVVVLVDGTVAEMGTYEELVAQKGAFSRLHAMQFGTPGSTGMSVVEGTS